MVTGPITRVWREGGFDAATVEANAASYRFGLRRLLDGIQTLTEQVR
ncbi:hypothetical protein [Microbispora sp. H10836]|nr:hypothetical protein [Microbispora sp. H10836]